MARLWALAISLTLVLASAESARSESERPLMDQPLQFRSYPITDSSKNVAATLHGADRFHLAWRLGMKGAQLETAAVDGTVFYLTKEDELRAVLPSGEASEAKSLPEDGFYAPPSDEIRIDGNYVTGIGGNGESWKYELPSGRTVSSGSVQGDLAGNIYFHDNLNDWYSLDSDGQERYVLRWGAEKIGVFCLVTPGGDSVCEGDHIGLFGIREKTDSIRLSINGIEQFYSQPPILLEGLSYVPFRQLFEALGAEIEWMAEEQAVEAVRGKRTVRLAIGKTEAVAGGKTIQLEHPPVLYEGLTLVPLRFAGEALGARVIWEQATRTIQIAIP